MKQFAHIDWSSLGPLRKSLKNPETGNPYTQAHLAKVANCSQSYIARIEKGQDMRSPDTVIVEGIARALKMPMESLLQQLDKKTSELPIQDRPNIVQITQQNQPQAIPLYKQSYSHPSLRLEDGILLETSQNIECPPFLKGEEGAYAVEMQDASMEPRYSWGDILFVNPNAMPRLGDDAIVQMEWDQEDGSRLRKVGFVREIVNIEDAWKDGASQDANNVEFLAHTLQQKIEHTYRGDFADRSSIFSPMDWYEDRAEMWPAFSNNGINAHLIVGVQFFRAKVQSGYGQKAYGEGAFGETSMQEIISDKVLKDLTSDEKAHLHKLQKRVTDAFLATQKAGSPDDIEAQMQWMQEQIAELEKKADG